MSRLGPLSSSLLLIACLFDVSAARAASADAPPCPAVWATSPVPWSAPTGHDDVAVSGTSPSDVWVAGDDADFSGRGPRPMLAHSDGTQWTPVSLPVGGPGRLVDLATISAGDVWSAGHLGTDQPEDQDALLLHWDGSSVMRLHDPISDSGADASSISGVAASSPENVWVVGRVTNAGITTPVAERWDGASWVEHDPVLPAGSDASVLSVSTTGPGDVWVAGGRRNEQGRAVTLAEHWNGEGWRVVRTPDDAGLRATLALTDIASVSRGDVWAVGLARYQNSPPGRGARVAALVNHWDGSSWTAMTPDRGIRVKYGFRSPAVAALGPGDVWISVDNRQATPPFGLLPFLHWDGSALRPVTVPVFGSNRVAVPVSPLGEAGPTELLAGSYGWMCPVGIGDGRFSPATASAAPLAHFKHLRKQQRIYPETVSFHVEAAAARTHEVKDASGLGLFDSGPVAPGGSFTYDLIGAGSSAVVDPTTGETGTIEAPVQISPRVGNVALGFAVGAGQSHGGPDGLHVDMQIREPGAAAFIPWPTGNLGGFFFWMRDPMWTVPGEYTFRARLVDPTTGAATDWSPEATANVKCCHADVVQDGFESAAASVIGTPFVWRVHDAGGQQHVVRDRSPLRLFRSPPLVNGQSFSHTFAGAGSYRVLDEGSGDTGTVEIRPLTSALFASPHQRVVITAATGPPKVPWRQWRIQIRRPGQTAFTAWRTGASAEFDPQQTGTFQFRARLYDTRLLAGIPWSPPMKVYVRAS